MGRATSRAAEGGGEEAPDIVRGGKTMRSEAQREASKQNGSKGRGPRDTSRSRFNGLKHGLRAEEVVLPGEDPAAFEALLSDYFDEWNPPTRTRAALVERLAIADWKLRRATRADAAHRRMTAEGSAYAFDNGRRRRVDMALYKMTDEPESALWDLESHAAGLDRLITAWAGLEEALSHGPSGWEVLHHVRLMNLHGRTSDAGPATVGGPGLASMRLKDASSGGKPLEPERAEADVAALRGVVATNLDRLRALRAAARDPGEERAEAVAAALADTTHGAQLLTRYELALERSYRSTLKKLMELAKTGDDLHEAEPEPAPAPEVVPLPPDPSPNIPKPPAPATPSSGSVGASAPRPSRAAADARRRGPKPSERAAKRARKGRSPS